ncbi:glycosyltransferase [Mangrovimonas futianensis]|uniref:glycosyltransferase n=1 Tax=Mangrovimonas futianensis TaxID=2895523 RepID=UPI001E47B030|nr:glycosyltransferase family 2 protein [Mangrovimonas futianensis]MCF1421389.1 glycosyltransferase [Mangrovimonas futianensis]
MATEAKRKPTIKEKNMIQSNVLVSIIIPTFNSKNYLKQAVNSALNQTFQHIEIIVVDDGSTDGTLDLFPEFQSQGVQCYSIPNGGASNARNFGLGKATGDYFQFLDADDLLVPTKIEKQINLMQQHDADLCYSPWINFKNTLEDAQKQFRFTYLEHDQVRTGKELMISFGMENWFILTVSWLVKKSLITKAGIWDVNILNNNDGEYFSRILFWAEKVVCCNEILAYYRQLPNSLGKLNSEAKVKSSFNSYIKIEALLVDCDPLLLSYPKRLYYMQYRRIRKRFPKLAKRAAKRFDDIRAPSFLSEKTYYWRFIQWFGLYRGAQFYNWLQPIWALKKRAFY